MWVSGHIFGVKYAHTLVIFFKDGDVIRYEVSDPPVSMDGLHGPSEIGQSGFRNPLGRGSIFVSFTNMGLVLLLGVLCS